MSDFLCPLPVVNHWSTDDFATHMEYRIEPCGQTVRKIVTVLSSDLLDEPYEDEPEWRLECDNGHVLLMRSNECSASDKYPKLTDRLIREAIAFLGSLRREESLTKHVAFCDELHCGAEGSALAPLYHRQGDEVVYVGQFCRLHGTATLRILQGVSTDEG